MAQLVALQTMLPQIENPAALQAKALQIRQLQNAVAASDEEALQRQRAMADDQAARAAFAANPTDGSARLAALAGVSPAAYGAEAKRMADLAKGEADTRSKQIETASKQLDLAGQAFGYVRRNPTLENAQQAIRWLTDNGVYSPEQAQQYAAQVQSNPAGIQALADQAYAAALSTKDQLMKVETRDTGGSVQTVGIDPLSNKVTTLNTLAKTQSPDSVAADRRAAADRAAADRRQERMIQATNERNNAKANVDASLDDASLELMADQYLRGDRTVFNNIGRGAQGSANLVALRAKIATKAQQQGITGADLAGITADYSGQQAALRTSGNISARVENAISEANELIPVALDASRNVARSGFLPFGKAQVMFNTQTNNPELKAFATANNGLVSAYAGAMARGQKPTVSDFEHARQILAEAQSQEAYEAAIAQMRLEMAAASRAPQNVRKHLRSEISGSHSSGNHSTVANPVAPAAPKAGAVESGYRFKGGDPASPSSWEKI